MKKQILLLILMLLPLAASADDSGSCGENVTYTFEEATGTLTISGTGAMYNNNYYNAPWYSYRESILKAIVTDGVTSIGEKAFQNCSGLTSVTIPNSVTSIGRRAFYYCSGLTSVTIPNSVTSIGSEAFDYCSGLSTVHISDLAAWCKITFSNPSSNPLYNAHHLYLNGEEIKDLVIPNSVTSIGNEAFYYCSGLTSVTIPNSVTSIGNGAFCYCSGLTSVTIGNSVTSIGSYSFSGCIGLTSVAISDSVTSIGDGAFYGCSGLTSITIPNSVTSIGSLAFYECSSLNTVIIGSGIKDIKEKAFGYCQNIENVYCYAVRYPSTHKTAFENSYPDYITLHVPSKGVEQYAAIEPWSNFHAVVAIKSGDPSVDDGGGEGSNSDKCATPTIDYSGKELTFNCETDGVEFVYEITDADVKKGNANILSLTATYEISVYATKAGYDNSDVATATLVWGSATFTETTPATAIEMVPAMEAAMPVLIQNNGGMLTVQGAQDGTPVSVYTIAGTEAGSAVSQNSMARISTSMQQGDIAIVRIGNRSVKVVLK